MIFRAERAASFANFVVLKVYFDKYFMLGIHDALLEKTF